MISRRLFPSAAGAYPSSGAPSPTLDTRASVSPQTDAFPTCRRLSIGWSIALAFCALAFALPSAVPAGEPAPLRERPKGPVVESVGDSTATPTRTARDSTGVPSPDRSLAAIVGQAPRVRLLMEDALRYEGERARADSAGLYFDDPSVSGVRFLWRDIATIEVSRKDRRWLGAGLGAVVGFALGAFVAAPTLDEEGLVSGNSLETLRLITSGVTAGLGSMIGYEVGRTRCRWEQVYP